MDKKDIIKEYTQNIRLSHEEKLAMFSNIQAHMNATPVVSPISSPWYDFLIKKSFAYSTLGVVFLTIATTSIIAEGAIPGNALYPVKVNINEPIVRTFHIGDTAKTKYSIKQTERRLEELSELAEKKKDKKEYIEVLLAKIDKHTEEIETFIETATQNQSDIIATVALETKEVFTNHISLLETILSSEDTYIESDISSTIDTEELVTTTNTQTISLSTDENSESTHSTQTDETQTIQIDTEETEQIETLQMIDSNTNSKDKQPINKKEILNRVKKFVE
jgi:hypothetical protein